MRCPTCGHPLSKLDTHKAWIEQWLRGGRSYAQIATQLERYGHHITLHGVRRWCGRRGMRSSARSGPGPKLDPSQAAALRQALADGMPIVEAMRRWKISRPTVKRYQRHGHRLTNEPKVGTFAA